MMGTAKELILSRLEYRIQFWRFKNTLNSAQNVKLTPTVYGR